MAVGWKDIAYLNKHTDKQLFELKYKTATNGANVYYDEYIENLKRSRSTNVFFEQLTTNLCFDWNITHKTFQ